MKQKSWIRNEILLSIFVPLVFLIIGVFIRPFFGDNAYPVDYDVIDSYEWADMFFLWYVVFSILCAIYHVAIAVIGQKFNIHSQKAWLNYGIIAVVVSLIGPVYITANWREESICTFIMYLMFLLEYIITFLLSTWKAPRHWDFCPF